MLQTLTVKNFAIIDELKIEFSDGLNVLTGETGAGKSILVQAISLLLGERVKGDVIRTGCESASVSAYFSIDDSPDVKKLLAELGLGSEEGLCIKREISDTGKGKIYLNGESITLGMLKRVSLELVDISSQHEHQLLLDAARHVSILDDSGVSRDTIDAYQSAYHRYNDLRTKLELLKKEELELKERLDFIKFQYAEFENASLKVDEEESILKERERLKYAVDLAQASNGVDFLLSSSADSAIGKLEKAKADLEGLENIEPLFKSWGVSIANCAIELKEVARELDRYSGRITADPKRLEEIDDRIHLIKSLKRKHNCTIEDCLKKKEELKEKIEKARGFDDEINQTEEEIKKVAKDLEEAGKKLGRARREAGLKLQAMVEEELSNLEMKKALFNVNFTKRPRDLWNTTGPDEVEFFLSPNVGEESKPIAAIASGGELSRVMLALKCVVGNSSRIGGCFIFDEVDAGIGGAVADMVGKKLAEVAAKKQVICITHLPQIAAVAKHHYLVRKEIKNNRTSATIVMLNKEDRIEELTRMLGGKRQTKALKDHVRELLR